MLWRINGGGENGNEITRKTLNEEPFSAYVIKTLVDPYLGSINILKVDSGVLHLGDEVYCPQTKNSFKISSLFTLCGKQQINVSEAIAGDIVAISKVEDINTTYTLCDKNNYILYKQIKFPTAVCFKAIGVKDKKDEEKLRPDIFMLINKENFFTCDAKYKNYKSEFMGIQAWYADLFECGAHKYIYRLKLGNESALDEEEKGDWDC